MNFRPRQRRSVDVNLTPLIDVVFLLLIFFMVTTTFNRQSELKIELPEAGAAVPEEKVEPIELVIDAKGRYFVNDQELVNTQPATVYEALREAMKDREETPLIIRADAQTPHQSVVTAMDAAAKLGLTRLSIATTRASDQ